MRLLTKQIIGKPLSIALYRAGMRGSAQFYWVNDTIITQAEFLTNKYQERPFAAYTLTELSQILPNTILNGEFSFHLMKEKLRWISAYIGKHNDKTLYKIDSMELVESVGRVILYLIKDGYINPQNKLAA